MEQGIVPLNGISVTRRLPVAATLAMLLVLGMAGGAMAWEPAPEDPPVQAAPHEEPGRTQPVWQMTKGAGILAKGTSAFEISGGMPSAGVRFHFPVLGRLDISPHIGYQYLWYMGFDTANGPDDVPPWLRVWHGMTFGLEIRVGLFDRGGHAVSFGFDTAFLMFVSDGYKNYGASFCAVEVRYSYRWDSPRIGVITGFRVPYWIQDGQSSVPILAEAGFEFAVASRVNLHLMVEAGVVTTSDYYQENWVLGPAVGCQAGVSVWW